MLVLFRVKELIDHQSEANEDKAVNTIKTNRKYFFSYAKRFANVKSSVSPLKDKNGNLETLPSTKAELLQHQNIQVFSKPGAANVERATSQIKPDVPSNSLNSTFPRKISSKL